MNEGELVEVSYDGQSWMRISIYSLMMETYKFVRPYKNIKAAALVAKRYGITLERRKK